MAEPDVSRRGINRAAPEYAVNSAFGYAPFRLPAGSFRGGFRSDSLLGPRAAWCACRESPRNRPGDLGGKHLVYFAP